MQEVRDLVGQACEYNDDILTPLKLLMHVNLGQAIRARAEVYGENWILYGGVAILYGGVAMADLAVHQEASS